MLSKFYLSCAASLPVSGQTTAQGSLPKHSETGFQLLVQRLHTSRWDYRGRTDTARASMPGSGTNCVSVRFPRTDG